MDSQTAFWFLAVLAQVMATIEGFLIVAFVFWLSKPSHSPEWRERLGRLTMVIFVFGIAIIFFALHAILDISESADVGSYASGIILILQPVFFAYLVAVAVLVGLIIWIGAIRTAEEEYSTED